jgi:hypothetical protein
MLSDMLRSIPGLEYWPVVALCLFVVIFVLVIIWSFTLDKKLIDQISRLPLDHSDESEGVRSHE